LLRDANGFLTSVADAKQSANSRRFVNGGRARAAPADHRRGRLMVCRLRSLRMCLSSWLAIR